MARKSKLDSVLGVFVTDTVVDAVLLRKVGDRVQIVNRLARPRSRFGDRISDLTTVLPGLKDSSEADFTLEIGDGTSGSDPSSLFLSSEFGGLGARTMTETAEKPVTGRQSAPITLQLKDILAECANLGYTSPHVCFCVGSSDVMYQEVGLVRDERSRSAMETKSNTKERTKRLSGAQRRQLLSDVSKEVQVPFDRNRVAFVRMASKNERERYLAVIPRVPDSIAPALTEINSSKSSISAVADIVDTEVTLYHALAKMHAPEEGTARQAVIRVGSEDTLVLFMKDGELVEFERIRSLTSYDPAETVCSRILLKQDEHKFGEIDNLLVVAEERRDDSVTAFAEYFPGAEVEWLQNVLSEHKISMPEEDELHLKASSIPAIGVGLRYLEQWDRADRHAYINLIPRKLVRRKGKKEKIAWHTIAMMVALFGIAFYFSWTFMAQQQQISQRETELALNPPEFPEEDPVVLKMKVDSLNAAYAAYTRALNVLDSLLVGSDKWTRAVGKMTESTGNIGRVWLRGWTPMNRNTVRLEGNALSRSRIAQLAQQWNGSIEQLNFADIQDVRVYTFTMMIPIREDMPPVAEFLRETALDDDNTTVDQVSTQ